MQLNAVDRQDSPCGANVDVLMSIIVTVDTVQYYCCEIEHEQATSLFVQYLFETDQIGAKQNSRRYAYNHPLQSIFSGNPAVFNTSN